MRRPVDAGVSCYEVMAEVNAVTDGMFPDTPVFLVGGGPAAAIQHEATRFDHESRHLIPTKASAESTIRSNGSRRDLDLLVFGVLPEGLGSQVERAVLEAIDHRMVVSVFGLEQHQQQLTRLDRLKLSLTAWTSRRTVDENGVHRFQIYPLEQIVPEPGEVYKPWQMELPSGGEITVMSPDTTVVNYDVRSVTPRKKDREKIEAMKSRIRAVPQFKDRLEGPLKPMTDLADAIVRLGQGTLEDDSPLLIPGATMLGLGVFRARAWAYNKGQQYEWLVKLVGHNEVVQKKLKKTTGRE
jgi:hypothetical protein